MKWPRTVLAVAALLALSGPGGSAALEDLEVQFKEISGSLVCQCGCNKMLTICEMQGCHSATPMRKEIRERLAAGETKEAILASFVDQYGLVVLSAPPTSGFHLSAWIMPFVVLGVGAVIAKSVLSSWKRQTNKTEAETHPSEISDEQRARIERELEDRET